MDPAGPGFTLPVDYGVYERLDRSDAEYVQCIFTNQFILATTVDCGHANFYMNGGMWQPGCGKDVACSHQRAQYYFSEALNPNNNFEGEQCESYSRKLLIELTGRKCSDVTDRIGIHTDHKSGRFYVKTNAQPPYAIRK